MNDELQKNREVIEVLLERRRNEEKIYSYAESLGDPWHLVQDKYVRYGLPYAHSWQRKMTYPVENETDFERFKKAIYYLYFAGNQGGKSVWGATWVVMECLGIHPLQIMGIRPKPPVHWWAVATELPAESKIEGGADSPLVKTFYEWCPNDKIKFYRKDKIMVIDGSTVNWKSHDQQKEKFKGERLDGVLFDEEPPKPIWDECVPRILKKKGIFLLAMTADYGSWTGQVRRQKNNPEYYQVEMDCLENPFMPAEYRKRVFDTMSEEQLFMRRFGRDIVFKGKVFPFEYDTHVKKPYEVSNDNVTGVIIDWHPAKPILVTYLQINPQNIWYTWAESVIEEKVVGRVAQEIRSKLSFPGFNVRVKKYIIDKIAKMEQVQETGQRAKDIVQMFREFGISCEIGNPSFGPAHTFLCDKMRHKEWYIDPSCAMHIEQFDTWGAKRYQKGNLEGTLRDQLEVEGNDAPINHVYAYNSGLKFTDSLYEEMPYVWQPRSSTSRIYGGAR